ncbi:MAG: hypothetical protein A2Y95_13250 [Deltaproteobacteria bacterium RBG_13_65_10]|nr:MAG: hypothetical protein A2Y95_13250 [Deltaproteobacteria bacterium RBG_13_65_10]
MIALPDALRVKPSPELEEALERELGALTASEEREAAQEVEPAFPLADEVGPEELLEDPESDQGDDSGDSHGAHPQG